MNFLAFSPLIVGSKVVTCGAVFDEEELQAFSPLIVGSKVVTWSILIRLGFYNRTFSPLIVGSKVVTLKIQWALDCQEHTLSVP